MSRHGLKPGWKAVGIGLTYALGTSELIYRLDLGSAALVVMYGLTAWLLLRRPDESLAVALRIWPLLLIPVICLLSALWSPVPGITIYQSVQFLITLLMGLVLAIHVPAHLVMKLVAGFFCFAVLASAVNLKLGLLQPVFQAGSLLGVFMHKNGLAQGIVQAGLAAICMGSYWRLQLGGIAAAMAMLPLLLLANSAGGTVLMLMLPTLLVALLHIRKQSAAARHRWVVGAISVIVLMALLIAASPDTFTAPILAGLGKDSTLTGRTLIWYFGLEEISANPIAGVGYGAFWEVPSYARVWIETNVDERVRVFHNAYIEWLVALGLIGGGWVIAVFLAGVVRGLRWFAAEGTVVSCFFLIYLIYLVFGSITETLFLRINSMATLLFVVAWVEAGRVLSARSGAARMGEPVPPRAVGAV